MRLFVIENNLQDKIGHFFNLSLGLKMEAERRGLETRFYVHRRARRDVTRPLGARPAFRYRSADQPSTHPVYGPVEDLLTIGRSFARSCRHVTSDGVGADDVVFVPTAQQNELYGIACWLSTLRPARRPFLFFNFHWAGFLDPLTGAHGFCAPVRDCTRSPSLGGLSSPRPPTCSRSSCTMSPAIRCSGTRCRTITPSPTQGGRPNGRGTSVRWWR